MCLNSHLLILIESCPWRCELQQVFEAVRCNVRRDSSYSVAVEAVIVECIVHRKRSNCRWQVEFNNLLTTCRGIGIILIQFIRRCC